VVKSIPGRLGARRTVGWVEHFAKPINHGAPRWVSLELNPSYWVAQGRTF